jgi:hypothetical protein
MLFSRKMAPPGGVYKAHANHEESVPSLLGALLPGLNPEMSKEHEEEGGGAARWSRP